MASKEARRAVIEQARLRNERSPYEWIRVDCDGPWYSDHCWGVYRDPSGDGHGGLNGGSLKTCPECQGHGKKRVRVRKTMTIEEVAAL